MPTFQEVLPDSVRAALKDPEGIGYLPIPSGGHAAQFCVIDYPRREVSIKCRRTSADLICSNPPQGLQVIGGPENIDHDTTTHSWSQPCDEHCAGQVCVFTVKLIEA